ncbi:MAG: SCO family protein [Gammaproteobacteria bacterium]|nr:SCO family protein [Gammaproteobacteria bacterium]MBU1600552.1 SCO family protein [Gammaproteobacteria bacterium]MBU2435008.1 SCO family protein [Gammaproteobacteria bacterium]MBU2448244.1 SCO family protein [Gammaproteobacteria bacterium]
MIRLVAALLLFLGAGPLFAQATQGLELLTEANGSGINPRYLLQDPNGRSITSEDFRGRFQLISFGYTYCPDICPTTLVEMAEILKQLSDEASHVQAIFISVDPERDTGKILKTYTEFFDPRILGLTASPSLVRHAADNFKIRYAKVREPGTPADRYAVDHSAGLILLGPDGSFVKKFAFATPVKDITEQMKNFIKNH